MNRRIIHAISRIVPGCAEVRFGGQYISGGLQRFERRWTELRRRQR